MKGFEYLLETVAPDTATARNSTLNGVLRDLGKIGWELVSAMYVPEQPPNGKNIVLAIFQRELAG
jgi:hypothetical protein